MKYVRLRLEENSWKYQTILAWTEQDILILKLVSVWSIYLFIFPFLVTCYGILQACVQFNRGRYSDSLELYKVCIYYPTIFHREHIFLNLWKWLLLYFCIARVLLLWHDLYLIED